MKFISDLNLSQALSIVSVPVLGYIAAFCYLAGKYTFLNLPVTFVEINTELAIISSLLVLFIEVSLLGLYLLTKTPNKNKYEEFKPVTKMKLVFTFCFVLDLFVFLTYLILNISIIPTALKMVLILLGFILLIVYVFVIPLVQYPNERDYLTKYNLYSEKVFKNNLEIKGRGKAVNIDLSFITNILKVNYIIYIIFIILWILLSYTMGYSIIQSQTKFPISTINDENYIIAGKYNGNLILVNVDVKNNITLNKFLLKSINETLTVRQMNIGKLNQIKHK